MKKLPDCSFPFADSDRIITVAYYRVAIRCSDSATDAETEKIKGFSVGFVCKRKPLAERVDKRLKLWTNKNSCIIIEATGNRKKL